MLGFDVPVRDPQGVEMRQGLRSLSQNEFCKLEVRARRKVRRKSSSGRELEQEAELTRPFVPAHAEQPRRKGASEEC